MMSNFSQSKILVVDDRAENRRSVCRILESLDGIAFIHAQSGEDALKQLLSHRFAVILLDVDMPGMDGYETAALISSDQDCKDIPIVMVTALGGSPKEVLKAYDAGAVDFIAKPIEPRILLNKVKQFVALDQSLKYSARLSEHRDRILNAAGEGVIEVDCAGIIQYCNPKACLLLQADEHQVIGSNFDTWFNKRISKTPESTPDNFHALYQQVKQRRLQQLHNLDICRQNGDIVPVEMNCSSANYDQDASVTMLFQDITERLNMERRLLKMASFDPLTDLANRAYFHSSLSQAMKRQQRLEKTLAVLFLDLDHFKYINDNYGHDAGDLLLKTAATRLCQCVREGDLVARMGGDEFSIVLYDINESQDITPIVSKIISSIAQPVDLFSRQVNTSVSIGIAVYNDDSMTMEELLKNADTAMYQAKVDGRNNYKVFASDMQDKELNRQRIQVLLHQAVPKNELSLVYQPKISLSRKRMVGCEALIRWQPTNAASISPAEFIPVAEESGQINVIGEWLLNAVFEQVSYWLSLPGFDGMSVSINVSTRQLKRPKFCQQVEELLNKHQIPATAIEFEVTETGMLDNSGQISEALLQLHQLGAKISIDDFGTGSSSLDHLRKLPFDILKIDRSFINDIGVDHQDEEIIRAVMAVAKTMGLEVIAEGVETQSQLKFLNEIHCELVQGYYFSKPLHPDKITHILNASQPNFSKKFHDYEVFLKQRQPLTPSTKPSYISPSIARPILLCDDNLDSAYLIQSLLLNAGYEVDIAISAREAKRLTTQKVYCALLLDLNLDDAGGLELLKNLRKYPNSSSLAAIVISASAEAVIEKANYIDLNIAAWFNKPINETKLLDVLEQTLPTGKHNNPPRILHYETETDTAVLRSLIKDIATITIATDLAQAKQALMEQDFDLVISGGDPVNNTVSGFINTVSNLEHHTPGLILTHKPNSISPNIKAKATGIYSKNSNGYKQIRHDIKTLLVTKQQHQSNSYAAIFRQRYQKKSG